VPTLAWLVIGGVASITALVFGFISLWNVELENSFLNIVVMVISGTVLIGVFMIWITQVGVYRQNRRRLKQAEKRLREAHESTTITVGDGTTGSRAGRVLTTLELHMEVQNLSSTEGCLDKEEKKAELPTVRKIRQ
jgi:hypothetical protein